jgi:hypothetical protein
MRQAKPRGIVLITVIFIAVLVAMYIVSASILNGGRFGALRQTGENRLAEEAAQSGIEYALARLEENPAWRGNRNTVTVQSPGLTVVEHRGNVVGLLTSPTGGISQFRLRFNHQDGAGGADDFDDPNEAMVFDSPHISVNNLLGSTDAQLPLGDGPGYAAQTMAGNPVPSGVVALVCEGRVAGALSSASATNPNPVLGRTEAVRVVEAFHRISGVTSESLTDAVGMAGKEFKARLYDDNGRLTLADTRENGSPRIRSHDGDITVVDAADDTAEVVGANGELLVSAGKSVTAALGGGVTIGEEGTNDAFYQLAWNQVAQPDGAGTLQAGVYEIRSSGVYHYAMNFEEYKTYKTDNPNDELAAGVLRNLDGTNGVRFIPQGADFNGQPSDRHRIVFTDDVLIERSGDVVDLTITPAKGAKEDLEPSESLGYSTDIDWSQTFSSGPSLSSSESSKRNFLANQVTDMENSNTNHGSPLHKFLLELGESGEITYGSNSYQWNSSTLNKNGSGATAFSQLLNGQPGATITISGRNESALPETGADIALMYEYFKAGGGNGSGGNSFSDNASTTDPTTVNDLEVNFAPENQNGVRLANTENDGGDIRIAADVRGEGASIKSDGEIRLVGMGFDLDAATAEEGPSISLYAKQDIVLSTLKPQASGAYVYSGMELRGLLYSWKNVELKAGHEDEDATANPQRVFLQGAMVAYGGTPGDGAPGTGSGGNILLTGDQIDLLFDPTQLVGLRSESGFTVSLQLLSRSFR